MFEFISNFWGIGLVLVLFIFIVLKIFGLRTLALNALTANHQSKLQLIDEKAAEQVKEKAAYAEELEMLKLRYMAGIILFFFIAMVLCLYLWKFNGLAFGDTADVWGQMGDYFGGMLNPIFAFASFMALLYTIRIQSEELRLTRSELAASRQAQEGSSRALQGQLENLQIQQFESTFFSLIGQIRLASLNPDKKEGLINNITWSASILYRKNFESDTKKLAEFSSTVFEACKSSKCFDLRYLSLITSSIVYVDENLKTAAQKIKYLSILSVYANDLESYLLYLWLANFNNDLTGERRKARDIINQYGFFRELIICSGSDSMSVATVFKDKLHDEEIRNGNIYVNLLRIKLSDAGFLSSCILGRPYPETILPVDISTQ